MTSPPNNTSPLNSLKSYGPHKGEVELHGQRYFLKQQINPQHDFFMAEARGLEALQGTGLIETPSVVDVSSHGILLSWITSTRGSKHGWVELAKRLSRIHSKEQAFFGFSLDGYCGDTTQPNPQMENGFDFFGQARLQYQAEMAFNNKLIEKSDLESIHRLINHLPSLLPSQPPVLIHGDLWSGNVLFDLTGQPVLIDPAAHYGWAEADIAFSLLFGGFDPVFYESYQSLHPFEPGFKQRVEIYNLYHLLNHLNLFGRSYYASVSSIINAF